MSDTGRTPPEPVDAEAALGAARAHLAEGRAQEALAISEQLLRAQPSHGEAWLARGEALQALGRLGEAVESYRSAFVRRDLVFDALVRLGAAFGAMGRFDLAIESLDAAVTLRPDAADVRLLRGRLRLQYEDFGGWDDYEARWRSERFVAAARGVVSRGMVPELALAPTAEDLAGQRILLVGEQGVGEQVMFASMIPDLQRAAASVVCVCEPRLVSLLAGSFPGVSVLSPATAQVDTDSIDKIVAMGSLGHAFRRAGRDFPGAPYLKANPDAAARWAARLGPRAARARVGLFWRAPSLSLDAFAPVLGHADCEFVSLQDGEPAAGIAAANSAGAQPIRVFSADELADFDELAGLVANLDVVISAPSALVDLCGGLGAPCLALVPQTPDWRYGAMGDAIPWYRSVRLFRQPAPGGWRPVVNQVAEALRLRIAAPSS